MKIGVVGAGGRMGQMLVRQVESTDGCTLAGVTHRSDSPEALFAEADAVIDFTVPAATVRHAMLAAQRGKILVLGTTGLSGDDEAQLREAAGRAVIVYGPNMAVGVTLLTALVERVARTLGPDFDIEIVEMHHRHKVDAPSGTALALGKAAAAGRGVALDEAAVYARHGHTGARKRGDVGFAVLRGGDVVGEHTVMFAGEGERIELTHKAARRDIFAAGAVRAALWARAKPPGLYSMFDVLGLS